MLDGEFVYQGRSQDVRKYMESIGMECPKNNNVTDHCLRKLYIANQEQFYNQDNNILEKF